MPIENRINRWLGCADLKSNQEHISFQSNPTTVYSTPYVACLHYPFVIQLIVLVQLRVDVKPSDPTPEIRPYVLGTPFNPASSVSLPYPINLVPHSKNAYFIPRESFNLVGMFQNPMMMIMVFTGVLMFAMPYIMVIPLG